MSGSSVPARARVQTLGESIQPDGSGSFVVQRILPPGEQAVAVQITGAGNQPYVERIIEIPRSEWFYTATVDLTFGRRLGDAVASNGAPLDDTYTVGRLAGFAKGRTANGWSITASADTGENDIEDLFRGFDEKDVEDSLLRAARENAYPTFGDDSTIEDGAPSDGKFFLRAERNGNHLIWGNYQATNSGSKYLRNERTLYGFSGLYTTQEQTTRGQARASVEAYAASPDRLPGREIFGGTGGSIYFLQREDVSVGTATLTVEVRDAVTGRVISTRTLNEGVDYDINYTQGSITLAQPLSAQSGSGGGVVTEPGGDDDVFLTVNYEYKPTAGDIDGLSYGARGEAWITDNLRVGVTGLVEQTDIADQKAIGADLRYEISENSFLSLEYAETEGPGFGASTSSTGGLIITSVGTAGTSGGTGSATSAQVRLDFADLGFAQPGNVSAYYEERSAGFSTLDYEVTDDETLWGIAVNAQSSERLKFALTYDDYENDAGRVSRELEASARYALNSVNSVELGLAFVERADPAGDPEDSGERTDLALRYIYEPDNDTSLYAYAQGTLSRSGGLEENNRIGIGGKYTFARNWTLEGEISDGSLGTAGEALVTYQAGPGQKSYIGYRLEPGRDLSGVVLSGRDRGTWVAGSQNKLNDRTDVFGEVNYDLFGAYRSLTNTYGVQYRATDALTFSASIEHGRVDDAGDEFDRNALSFGVSYDDGEGLQARSKLEYRKDTGLLSGTDRGQELIFVTASMGYKVSDDERIIFNLEYADTDTDDSSVLSGTYGELTLGYAYRPVLNDRLNVLAQYRYLYDMIGQEIDGTDTTGPRQESHVVSVDVVYDLDPQWTVGAKLGGRFSESSPSEGVDFASNDAWLVVLNARYNLTHKWDALIEARHLEAQQAGLSETGFLAAGYRHIGNNYKVGVGYNFSNFSDDLTDLVNDDRGVFVNLIAKF